MVFYGFHGMSEAEQELGQRFDVDLVVQLDLKRAGESDMLEDTVSYTHLYRTVKRSWRGRAANCLRTSPRP
ncbi:Dihydroneopterin aldolase [Geodia barretti]|nr:Dihydroneopterin aldolase [Geodia barretti]